MNRPLASSSPVWAEPVLAPAETMQSVKYREMEPRVTRSPMPFFTAARVSSEIVNSLRTWDSWRWRTSLPS